MMDNQQGDDSDDVVVLGPRPTIKQVLACQFSSWYPTFSNLVDPYYEESDCGGGDDGDHQTRRRRQREGPPRKNVTIPSIIIHDIPYPEFRNYLLSDGIRLPLDATKLSSFATETTTGNDDNDDDDDDVWSSTEHDEDEPKDQNDMNGNTSKQFISKADDDDKEEEDTDEDDESSTTFHFPTLNAQIIDAIQSFPKAGGVIPKLNWSAPRDATWINGGSMKCTTPGDVYLLLKSSDFCLHDVLGKALEDCNDYDTHDNDDEDETSTPPEMTTRHDTKIHVPLQLVLRKWCNLHPSMEFRCFIRRDTMIAISQRHHSQHYPHLMSDWQNIRDTLQDFWYDCIRGRFNAGCPLPSSQEREQQLQQQNGGGGPAAVPSIGNSSYVVDLYLDQKDRVWIIDFNPWARSTDSLLFEWSELMVIDVDDIVNDDGPFDDGDIQNTPEMRIVETEYQVRHDPLSSYRAPIDTVDLASMTRGDSKQFEEFMTLCRQQQ